MRTLATRTCAVLDFRLIVMPLDALTAEVDELTHAQKYELIKRVAGSAEFRRALRLREFLLFVGQASFVGTAREVHEQDIGVKVFGRAPDYDRGADNIVRVNATELRKRLDRYFAEEGADETYVFTIPRGGYKPVFSRRLLDAPEPSITAPAEAEPPPPEILVSAPPGGRGWMWACLVFAGTSLLLLVGLLVSLSRARPSNPDARTRPLVMAFWRDFTHDQNPDAQVDVVLPDESASLMEDILRRPIALQDYVDRSYINAVDASSASPDRKADVQEILRHNLVTFGTVMAARQMLMLPGLAQHFHVTLPRLYPPDLMQRNNLIVVGGRKSNPWAGFFEGQVNFTLEYDPKTSQNIVVNHHPLSGEQAVYQPLASSNLPSGIAVLAYIRNPGNTGDVLLLTGSDSDATAAAADFITSEASMHKLLQLFGRSRLPHFEVVLRTTRLNGTSFTSEIAASRLRDM